MWLQITFQLPASVQPPSHPTPCSPLPSPPVPILLLWRPLAWQCPRPMISCITSPGSSPCYFITAIKSTVPFPVARTELDQLCSVTLPSSRCIPKGENNGKDVGPWAALGGWQRDLAPDCTNVPRRNPGQSTFLAFCRVSAIFCHQKRDNHIPDLRIAGLLITHVVPLWESDKEAGGGCSARSPP